MAFLYASHSHTFKDNLTYTDLYWHFNLVTKWSNKCLTFSLGTLFSCHTNFLWKLKWSSLHNDKSPEVCALGNISRYKATGQITSLLSILISLSRVVINYHWWRKDIRIYCTDFFTLQDWHRKMNMFHVHEQVSK